MGDQDFIQEALVDQDDKEAVGHQDHQEAMVEDDHRDEPAHGLELEPGQQGGGVLQLLLVLQEEEARPGADQVQLPRSPGREGGGGGGGELRGGGPGLGPLPPGWGDTLSQTTGWQHGGIYGGQGRRPAESIGVALGSRLALEMSSLIWHHCKHDCFLTFRKRRPFDRNP